MCWKLIHHAPLYAPLCGAEMIPCSAVTLWMIQYFAENVSESCCTCEGDSMYCNDCEGDAICCGDCLADSMLWNNCLADSIFGERFNT